MLFIIIEKDHSKKRHILKTIKIGGFEIVTKMVLYYAHERVWFKFNFGLPNRQKKKELEK